MDGPDPRVMITGLCRAGHTVQNLLNFIHYAFADYHDWMAMEMFSLHVFSGLTMDNAFLKFGKLQLEYKEVMQVWNTGEYKSAGARAAKGLIEIVDYDIPVIKGHYHVWPFFMLQDITRMGSNQKAADTASGLMIGLLDLHNYDNLTACFHDPESFIEQVEAALELLVSRKNENIAEAVHKIS